MAEIPKSQQDYFNKIKQALETGDEDMLSDLVKTKNPLAIRHDLSTTLGQHVRENYDDPLNVFNNKEILKDIPVNYTKLPDGIAGRYSKDKNQLYLPHEDLEIPNRQMGTRLHEYGHADDVLKGFEESQPFNKTKSVLKSSGLQSAEEALGKHHSSGFFEKEALSSLLNNKKLGGNMADNSDKIKKLTELLQGGQITPDMYKENVSKLLTVNQSMRPEVPKRAGSLSDLISSIGEKGGSVQNLRDELKVSPDTMAGIKADVAARPRFPGVKSAMEGASDVGKMVNEDAGAVTHNKGILSMLKNSQGIGKVLPMLGMGATALAGLGIANKVQAGELGDAGLDTADLATDYVPGVAQAKMALRPSELGNEELPHDDAAAQQSYNDSIVPKDGYENNQFRFKNTMSKLNK